MLLVEKLYNPFVRKNDTTVRVMTDVVIALLLCLAITWFAYGSSPLMVVLTSVGSALTAEFLFNALFRRDTRSLGDGSAIVTGILMAFTIGPFTPLPIVALGAAAGVIFGKLLWGGIGRNRFNPALVGREIMVVFFPAIMNSAEIWSSRGALVNRGFDIFGNQFWDRLLYWPTGAIGEYAPILLVLGGIYLIARRRISWHIPLAMLATFTAAIFLLRGEGITFSRGGLLLGAIYMATDMPTSSSTKGGKIYFGAMAGIIALACIMLGAQRGYLSYSILIMNAFVVPVNWIFRPATWGKAKNTVKTIWQAALLTLAIIAVAGVVLLLHHAELLLWPVLAYMLYSILRFAFSDRVRPWARLLALIGKNG